MASTIRHSMPSALCAVLLAATLLAGCQLVSRGATPAGKSPPTTTALSMADYGRVLNNQVEQVSFAVEAVDKVDTYSSLETKTRAAGTTTASAVQRLRDLKVPEGTKSAHDRFVEALQDLRFAFGYAADDVNSQALCVAPAVLARIDKDGLLGRLDAAGQELAAVTGGQVKPVQLVPAVKKSRPLTNGTLIRGHLSGPPRNYITIDNKDKWDVVITLARGKTGKKAVFSIFAKRKSKVTLRGIPDGTYHSFGTQGRDWDRKLRAFGRECSFFRYKGSESWGVHGSRITTGWVYTFGGKRSSKGGGSVGLSPKDAIRP